MTSDSVASFLDLARTRGLLAREQVDGLAREPDMPRQDLPALCGFLERRGVLTAYQAERIRAGREQELTFAGYPILGELGPCPGGTAYKASHPSLRTPLVLRRLRADWLAPADNLSAYVQRAQAALAVAHPNLTTLLDAGVSQEEPFVVMEPFDGSSLETLVADIGPMPAALAAEYGRQAAQGLAAAHDRKIAHGDVRPANVLAGPMVASTRLRPDGSPRMRPAPAATVKVAELGLVPLRAAPAGDYRPPEGGPPTAGGDVYGLGATLYHLLTGKNPADHAPLGVLRPDLPAALVALVEEMTAETPADRPTTAQAVEALSALAKGRTPPPRKPDSEEVKLSAVPHADVDLIPLDAAAPVELLPDHDPAPPPMALPWVHPDDNWGPPDAWGQPAPADFVPAELVPPSGVALAAPVTSKPGTPAPPKDVPKKRFNRKMLYFWIGVGLLLNLTAVILWGFFFGLFGSGSSEPENNPQAPQTKKVAPKANPKPNKPQGGS